MNPHRNRIGRNLGITYRVPTMDVWYYSISIGTEMLKSPWRPNDIDCQGDYTNISSQMSLTTRSPYISNKCMIQVHLLYEDGKLTTSRDRANADVSIPYPDFAEFSNIDSVSAPYALKLKRNILRPAGLTILREVSPELLRCLTDEHLEELVVLYPSKHIGNFKRAKKIVTSYPEVLLTLTPETLEITGGDPDAWAEVLRDKSISRVEVSCSNVRVEHVTSITTCLRLPIETWSGNLSPNVKVCELTVSEPLADGDMFDISKCISTWPGTVKYIILDGHIYEGADRVCVKLRRVYSKKCSSGFLPLKKVGVTSHLYTMVTTKSTVLNDTLESYTSKYYVDGRFKDDLIELFNIPFDSRVAEAINSVIS